MSPIDRDHLAMLREFAGEEIADDAVDEAMEERISETLHLRATVAKLQEENERLRGVLKDTAWELDCVLEALNEATAPDLYATTKSDGMSALASARAALSSGAAEGEVEP